MKYSIGLVACIAIIFCWIQSPQSTQVDAKPPHDAHVSQTQSKAPQWKDEAERLSEVIVAVVEDVDLHAETVSILETEVSAVATAVAKLESRVKKLEDASEAEKAKAKAKPQVAAKAPVVVTPPPIITSTPAFVVEQSYTGRWKNNDGRSARNHAIEVHGFDPSLSNSELARLHDSWHDMNGSQPPTGIVRQRTRTFTVTPRSTSDCPGGVCPAPGFQRTVTSSGGWYLGKNLGRRRR